MSVFSCSDVKKNEIKVHHRIFSDSLETKSGKILPVSINPKEILIEDGTWIFYDDSTFLDTTKIIQVKNFKLTKSYRTAQNPNGEFNKTYFNELGICTSYRSFLNGKLEYETIYSKHGNLLKDVYYLENGREELYFKRNQKNDRNETYIQLDFDSIGNLVEAYKIISDTSVVEDVETGEIIQIIQEKNIPLESFE